MKIENIEKLSIYKYKIYIKCVEIITLILKQVKLLNLIKKLARYDNFLKNK